MLKKGYHPIDQSSRVNVRFPYIDFPNVRFYNKNPMKSTFLEPSKICYTRRKIEAGVKMDKFMIGESVQIKQGFQMAGYLGIIVKYFEKNHTYLIRFSPDQELFFPEEAFEVKRS